jgi:F-type H+-transporting ATPase subunit gamma
MAGSIEIKRRIKSVKSTKKITRAMQMVSAAKMRKAQAAALQSRTYSDLAWQIITNLSSKVDPKYHALLAQDENQKSAKKVAVILVTSNRGLIGGFNTNLINALKKTLAKNKEEMDLAAEIEVMGKKGREAMLRMNQTIVADFPKQDRTIGIGEILPISKMIIDEYLAGKYSKIIIAYTHYVSTLTQKPVVKQLLPFETTGHENLPEHSGKSNYEYEFEPTPNDVLDYLVPRILESQIYQAILESDASEHSARMIMMKNATDAASDLIDDLTLTYNQLRQANITKELAEITAGRIALE